MRTRGRHAAIQRRTKPDSQFLAAQRAHASVFAFFCASLARMYLSLIKVMPSRVDWRHPRILATRRAPTRASSCPRLSTRRISSRRSCPRPCTAPTRTSRFAQPLLPPPPSRTRARAGCRRIWRSPCRDRRAPGRNPTRRAPTAWTAHPRAQTRTASPRPTTSSGSSPVSTRAPSFALRRCPVRGEATRFVRTPSNPRRPRRPP
mmetsp:Transcript_9977/g.45163  ORF Transcript_9977/g.45163 Transcript_9977/m.45163 type:complete len:204 (-) Transcript_9977:1569-2180(-)